MPAHPLPDEDLRETVALVRAHGSPLAAARATGAVESTVRRRWHEAARRGLLGFKPVLPGFEVSKTTTQFDRDGRVRTTSVHQRQADGEAFAMPEGHRIKGVSVLERNGREVQRWIKTREGALDPREVAGWLKDAFADYTPASPVAPDPPPCDDDLLTLIPLSDLHMGLYAWEGEVGENWNLKTAEAAIGGAVEELMGRTKPSAEAVVLGGGDLLHSDNSLNRTNRSGHPLEVDGRYQKVVLVTCRLVVRVVDAALRRHARVRLRLLAGNHDEHTSIAITYFLLAWYRLEPRVVVDIDSSLFWWHRHGQVLLGATHGHMVKIDRMPGIMAHRRAEDWGHTKFRYAHGFHLHRTGRIATEGNGVVCEVHQTPIPKDTFNFGSGFLSGRSMTAITYHKACGEYARDRVAIVGKQP